MTGAPRRHANRLEDVAAVGTVTDDRRTVVRVLVVGLLAGTGLAWLLIPLGGLERAIVIALGGVAGLCLAVLALVLTSYAQQLLATVRPGHRTTPAAQRAAAE